MIGRARMPDIRRQTAWVRIWAQRWLWVMLVPGLVYIAIFNYIPMFGVVLAFRNASIWDGIFGSRWIGLHNFRFLLNPEFLQVFRNTLTIASWKLLFTFTSPLVLALLLNEVGCLTFKRIVQSVTYMPYFISWVILAGLMDHLLSTQVGLVNEVLRHLGGQVVNFRGDPDWFLPLIVISAVWKTAGFSCIIYLAALAGIDPQLYEAATVDGAGRLGQLWHITLPGLFPTITILLVLAAPGLVNAGFDQVYLFQNPLNIQFSEIIDSFVLKMGLNSGLYSFAAAVGLFNSVLSTLLVLTVNFLSKRVGGSGIW